MVYLPLQLYPFYRGQRLLPLSDWTRDAQGRNPKKGPALGVIKSPFRDCSADEQVWGMWFRPNSPYNIGIVLRDDWIVLDIDAYKDGVESLALLLGDHELPCTLMMMSGRNDLSCHIYFRNPDLTIDLLKSFPGIDVRARRGKKNFYMAGVAPSPHYTTGRSSWWENVIDDNLDASIAVAPDWLMTALTAKLRLKPQAGTRSPDEVHREFTFTAPSNGLSLAEGMILLTDYHRDMVVRKNVKNPVKDDGTRADCTRSGVRATLMTAMVNARMSFRHWLELRADVTSVGLRWTCFSSITGAALTDAQLQADWNIRVKRWTPRADASSEVTAARAAMGVFEWPVRSDNTRLILELLLQEAEHRGRMRFNMNRRDLLRLCRSVATGPTISVNLKKLRRLGWLVGDMPRDHSKAAVLTITIPAGCTERTIDTQVSRGAHSPFFLSNNGASGTPPDLNSPLFGKGLLNNSGRSIYAALSYPMDRLELRRASGVKNRTTFDTMLARCIDHGLISEDGNKFFRTGKTIAQREVELGLDGRDAKKAQQTQRERQANDWLLRRAAYQAGQEHPTLRGLAAIGAYLGYPKFDVGTPASPPSSD